MPRRNLDYCSVLDACWYIRDFETHMEYVETMLLAEMAGMHSTQEVQLHGWKDHL